MIKQSKLLTALILLIFSTCLPASQTKPTIAIIGAMEVEIEKLLPEIEHRKEITLRGMRITPAFCGDRMSW